MKIEFPPHLCNKKCPRETKNGYRISPQSYISIPQGTKLEIYVNVDPNDPSSDVEMVEVIVSGSQYINAILVDRMVVRKPDV